MHREIVTLVLMLVLLGFACTSRPRTIKRYSKDGISFNHYSDWSVTKDEPIDDNPNSRAIDLEGPNDAIVIFICVPPQNEETVETFAAALADGRGKDAEESLRVGPIKPLGFSNGGSEPTIGRVGGGVRNGILQRFSIKLLGQEVPHQVKIFAVENNRFEVFIITQVATEDLHKTSPAFDLTLDSISMSDVE